jgi:hypothetical protein
MNDAFKKKHSMPMDSENTLTKIFVGVAIAVISAFIVYHIGLDRPDQTNDVTFAREKEYSNSKSISGTYTGYCYNRTYGQKGKLILNINHEQAGTVHGTINITGELYGSGEIEGHFDGKKIGFASKEQSTGLIISWQGRLTNNEMAGDYTVSVPPYMKAQTGLVDQVGEWKVSQ